jgi:hypothetical protein
MTSHNRLNILVLCDYDGRGASVIRDFLYSFNAYSSHSCYYMHGCKNLDASLDYERFDVIVIFWSCLLFWGLPACDIAAQKIARSRALKVLFLQDEYRSVRANNRLAAGLGVQLICSCVAEKDFDIFYPRSEIPTLQAVYPVLTGYVPEYMAARPPAPLETRPIDIGYRTRVMPFHLGDLACEKLTIAKQFERIAAERSFTADISVREEDRLYGKEWQSFLESCKFTLGTESGASVIDFSGEIGRRCAAYLKTHRRATYAEVRDRFFADVDGRVTIQTISPRMFEAAAYGSVQILHEGAYDGMLRPDEHFISVKKDYSNVDEVVERMRDTAFCRRLRDNAYRDLIASGKYSYCAFIRRFDEVLARHAGACPPERAPSKVLFYLGNYVFRGETIIPRNRTFVRAPRPTLRHVTEGLPWVLLVVGLLWDVPLLCRPLTGFLLRPWRWQAWRGLWSDLICLGALRFVQGGGPTTGQAFRVAPVRDEDDPDVHLVSQPLHESNEYRLSLDSDRCRWLVWDHAPVGACVSLYLGGQGSSRLLVGTTGSHRFTELMRFCRLTSADTGALVATVLSDRPSALQSWKGLRPLVIGYAISCALCRHVICEPCQRLARFARTVPFRVYRAARTPIRVAYHLKPGLRVLLVWAILQDVPLLRRFLVRFLVRPGNWKKVGLAPLWNDLQRLSALRLARSGGWFCGGDFRIEPLWQDHAGTCRLVSAPVEASRPVEAVHELPDQLRDALAWRRCRRLVWDHSAIALATACGPNDYAHVWLTMGKRGAYPFSGLARLCRLGGRDLSEVVRAVLSDPSCSLQSGRLLRVLVRCQLLGLALIRFPLVMARLVVSGIGRNLFTLPQRVLRTGRSALRPLTPRREPQNHPGSAPAEEAPAGKRHYRNSA